MAIEETIILTDEVSGAAEDAAAAALSLADALNQAADAARAASGNAEQAASADKALGAAANQAASSERRLGDAAEDAASANQAGAGSSLLNAQAMVSLAEKAARAAIAIGKLVIAIAKTITKAVAGREQLKLMLDQATKGHGAEALAGIDKMAKSLGLSAEEATQQFITFRNQGLKNIDSANLIKLRADLLAVGVGADQADEAIKGTIDAIKGGKNASAAIAETAKQFGALGTGANAAAARVFTVKGALENAEAAGGRLLDRVGEALAPAFTAAANAVTNFLDALEGSKEFQMVIESIKVAAVGFGEGFMAAAKPVIGLFKQLGIALGGSEKALERTKSGFKGVGAVIGAVVTVLGAVVVAALAVPSMFVAIGEAVSSAASTVWSAITSALDAVGEFVTGITDGVSEAVSAVGGFVSSFFQAGVDLIMGFINGIVSMASKVGEAVSNLGSAAADSLKSALGIGSPSKVAMSMGENFGSSFTDAVSASMPPVVNAPSLGDDRGGAMPRGGSGGNPVSVVVNVAQTNATATDIETAVARGVESGLRMARA